MKRIAMLVFLALAAFIALKGNPDTPGAPVSADQSRQAPAAAGNEQNRSLQRAIASRADGVPVQGVGEVIKLLADDREGSPHQRFILRLASGDTLLVAHNIALADRLAPLAVGDRVEFSGEYAWNAQGGVVHWTHHDPDGRHAGGWLRHGGRMVQ